MLIRSSVWGMPGFVSSLFSRIIFSIEWLPCIVHQMDESEKGKVVSAVWQRGDFFKINKVLISNYNANGELKL